MRTSTAQFHCGRFLRAATTPKLSSSNAARSQIQGRDVKPEPGSRGKPPGGTEVRRVVLTFTVAVDAAELLGVTEEGETEQDASVGAPLQDNVTGSLYPATELTVAVTLAVFPATTEVLPGETATPKSEPPPVSVTNCGLLGAESLMVRMPVFDPKTVGIKLTLIVQMALGATAPAHVLD